ncbi:flagellar biosynthesis protein FlgA [Bdellovibrio bacteriovorus]|uniref:Flagellar biosynthesis protein FlgA n=1 Tax=Bdellovibrio bacteriovorus TaxID=959 RepID=A0A150WRZ6_BDEBC|nr:flagellar basal body P-ring formation chaperone FlgA [Bdellovibrio bacteriovorus]KYG67156.1 flagellar biosynthesis protein FlgA [Bdellovibrio bacteriovorus]
MKKLVFAFLMIASTTWARPEIEIPAQVEISQRPLLRLSDVARLTQGNANLLAFMDDVVLREDARDLVLASHMNAQEILTKVRSIMKNRDDVRLLNPSFKIPSQVKVSFSKEAISHEEVNRKILNHLNVTCPSCEYRVSVTKTPVPSQKEWDLDFSQMSTKGGFLLPLREGSDQIKWISGTIRVSQLTPVATRLILQGERVQSGDVRMVMTDVTYAKDSVVRAEDIQGQVAARSLAVGTPIWTSDLKREPAAKKGQIVKAMLGDETFEISVNMQAEDNGFIGDLIKVKNIETQKVMSGLVVEKGVVKLQ